MFAMSLFEELKRRNVIRVGIAYLVAVWILLQIADLVLENIGAPDWVIQAIMLLMAIGFPLVVIFAWAFEMTPQGIMLEKNVNRAKSITSHTGRKLDYVIIAALALMVVYLLVDKLVLRDSTQVPARPISAEETATVPDKGPSVAVLPFVNMSGDTENEYFSDGLTETWLHMLAQLPNLRVAARTSSFAFKGQNPSITEIASALGVAHILEGSVQKADARVRITAQLIRADDGFHIWSQNYTRPLEDIFAIQDEIAADVADALGSSLLGNALSSNSRPEMHGVSTTDVSAYDSYLKGLEQQAIFSYGSLDRSENHFRQALAQDPEFIDARLALVRNHLLKYDTGLITRAETRSLTQSLVQQVREQEPDNPLGRALEISLLLRVGDELLTTEAIMPLVDEFRGLVQKLPTETYIRIELAEELYFTFQKFEEAIELLQAGLMIDPLAADLHREMGTIFYNQDQIDQARTALMRALELAPNNPNSYGHMAGLERRVDNVPAALEWKRQAVAIDPLDHELAAIIATDLYGLQLPEEGERWFVRVQALAPESAVARNLAVRRAVARGETSRAIDLAAKDIKDQISMRRGAFDDSLFTYVDLMMQQDRAREAFDYLVKVRPDIVPFDQLTPDVHGFDMQWAALTAMSGFESFEQRKLSWNQLADQIEDAGLPWLQDLEDEYWTWNLVMNGETEKAADRYLEIELNKPLTYDLLRHTRRLYAFFAPVYEDPRVQAKLAEQSRRYEQIRADVRAMMEKPEWNK
jgi:TolB-like protein/Tfp pilus assembly protein PilF